VELKRAALRERRETFCRCRRFVEEFTKGARGFQTRFRLFGTYPWPGNVRELRNAMSGRAAFRSELILPEHLPRGARSAGLPSATAGDASNWRKSSARHLQALKQHDSNARKPQALGISRRALLYKLQRFREQVTA